PLPQASSLAEAIRRRRASGGPAERTFATLVGLELRPRRLREAAAIWRGLTDARGIEGRDAVWAHPDLLPTAEDFDDPDGFVRGRPDFDISDLESERDQNQGDQDQGDQDQGAKDQGAKDQGDEKPGDEKPGDEKPGDEKPGDEKPGD